MERLTFERVPVLVLAIAACCLSHKSQQSIGVADCTSSSADGFFSEINLAERIQQERNAVTEFSPSPPPRPSQQRRFQRRDRMSRKADTNTSVIARDVLSLANTGCPGLAPIHHA